MAMPDTAPRVELPPADPDQSWDGITPAEGDAPVLGVTPEPATSIMEGGRGSFLSVVPDQTSPETPVQNPEDNITWPDTQILADGLDKVLDKAQAIEPATESAPKLSIVPNIEDSPTSVNVSVHRSASAPAKVLHRLGNGGAERPLASPITRDKESEWPKGPMAKELEERQAASKDAIANNLREQKQNRARLDKERVAEWKEKRRQELVGEIQWARQSLGRIEERLLKSLDRMMGTEEDEEGNPIPNERLDRAQQATKDATAAALKATGKASLKAGKWAGKEAWGVTKKGAHKAHEKWRSRHESGVADDSEDDETELDGEALDNSLAEAWRALDSGDNQAAKEKLRAAIKAARAEDVVFSPDRPAPVGAVNPDVASKHVASEGKDISMEAGTPDRGEISKEDQDLWDRKKVEWMTLGSQLAKMKNTGQIPEEWRTGGGGTGGGSGNGGNGGSGNGGNNGGSGNGGGNGGGTQIPVQTPGTGPAVPANTRPSAAQEAPAPTSPEAESKEKKKRRKLLKRALVGAAALGIVGGSAMLSKYGLHVDLGAYGHMLHINWNGWMDAIKSHFGGGVHNNGNTVPEGFHQVHLTPGDTVWDETAKALGHQPTHDQVGEVLRDNGMQWSGGGPGVDAHDLPIGQAVNIPNNLGG